MATRKKLFRYGAGFLACAFVIVAILSYQNAHSSKVAWISAAEAQNRVRGKRVLERTADFFLRWLPGAHQWVLGKLQKPLLIEGCIFETANLQQAYIPQTPPATNALGMRAWVISTNDFIHLMNEFVTNSDVKIHSRPRIQTSSGINVNFMIPIWSPQTISLSKYSLWFESKPVIHFNSLDLNWLIERGTNYAKGIAFASGPLAGLHSKLGKSEALLVDTNQRLNGGQDCWFVFVWQKL